MAEISQSQYDDRSLPEWAKYLTSAIIVVLAVGATLGLTMLREAPKTKQSDALIPLVKTTPVVPFTGELDLVVSGTVVPFREMKIAAEVGGKIIEKSPECEAGNYVEKGTKLLQIDTKEYDIEISAAEREIDQAKKSLNETEEEIRGAIKNLEHAQTDLDLQQKEFDRNVRLKGVLSDSEMDAAKRALLNSRTQLTVRENTLDMLKAKKESMQASLEVAKSRLGKAEFDLARTTIRAPGDGIIVQESVEQGDNVFPNSALIVVEDTSHAEVRCNLTPSELNWLRRYASSPEEVVEFDRMLYRLPNSQVQIFETTDPEVIWTGTLGRFDGIGRDELTKSIPCRIVVPDPVAGNGATQKALVRGMYVKCRIVVGTPTTAGDQQLAAIPEVAVRPGNYVWAVRDKKLHRFDISIIDRATQVIDGKEENLVVISLQPNNLVMDDAIVITPLPQPTEGGPVLLENGKIPSIASEPQTAGESPSKESSRPATAVAETGGKS